MAGQLGFATGAADFVNAFNRLGGSRGPMAQRNDAVKSILREREQRERNRRAPGAFGQQAAQQFVASGGDPAKASRLARTRARGSAGFQNFSRNVDPLSGRHLTDFISDAQMFHQIKKALGR